MLKNSRRRGWHGAPSPRLMHRRRRRCDGLVHTCRARAQPKIAQVESLGLGGFVGPRLAHVASRRAGSDFAASGPFFNTLLLPWIIDFLKKKSPAAARGGLGAEEGA